MIDGIMAGLVVLCVGLLPWSILEAAWVPRANTLAFVCALSMASGVLIAPLKWRRAIRWPIDPLGSCGRKPLLATEAPTRL